METKDYKQEIIATRKGCLGSSDGTLLAQVATLGYVPKSAEKRLAIVKGLIESKDNVTTKQMRFGDFVETNIYEHLSAENKLYESNPLWVSEKYQGKNVKLISHPDIVYADGKNKVLHIYEVKATVYNTPQTKATYKNQLYIHWLLGNEIVERNNKEYNEKWKVRVYLVRYDTVGIDMDDEWVFEPSRMEISLVKVKRNTFDIRASLDIIDEYLETFDAYYEDDDIDATYLPDNVKEQFDKVTTILQEIKERERKVEEFKAYLYDYLLDKNIKSIKNDVFTISRIDPTESRTFDAKAFLDDFSASHPRKARALKRQYEKITKRKGYAKITLKGNKDK